MGETITKALGPLNMVGGIGATVAGHPEVGLPMMASGFGGMTGANSGSQSPGMAGIQQLLGQGADISKAMGFGPKPQQPPMQPPQNPPLNHPPQQQGAPMGMPAPSPAPQVPQVPQMQGPQRLAGIPPQVLKALGLA